MGKSFSEFLARVKRGSVLITSRSRMSAAMLVKSPENIISVGPLEDDQALELLRYKLQKNIRDDKGKTLLRRVGNSPLAILGAAEFAEEYSKPQMQVQDPRMTNDTEMVPAAHQQQQTPRQRSPTEPDEQDLTGQTAVNSPLSDVRMEDVSSEETRVGQRRCGKCRELGHRIEKCPQNGARGHETRSKMSLRLRHRQQNTRRQVNEIRTPQRKRIGQRRCGKCHGLGHYISTCSRN
jgi:hypothetical protein